MAAKTLTYAKSDPPRSGVRGAVHADLEGARNSHRYRPTRFHNESLSNPIECSFLIEDEPGRTAASVIDVSATGLAIEPAEAGERDTRSTNLTELIVSHRGESSLQAEAPSSIRRENELGSERTH